MKMCMFASMYFGFELQEPILDSNDMYVCIDGWMGGRDTETPNEYRRGLLDVD